MSSTFYLIVISFICAVAVVVLQFSRQLSTLTKKKFIDKTWFKFTIDILLVVIAFWANYIKDYNSSHELKTELANRDALHESEITKRDSLHNIGEQEIIKFYSNKNDSINRINTLAYIDELAKYGLHYDSSQNKIVKLVRDSINNENLDLSIGAPNIRVHMKYIALGDSINGDIPLCDNGNCPINIFVTINIIGQYNNQLYLIPETDTIEGNLSINECLDHTFSMYFRLHKYDKIFFFFRESYASKDRKKIHNTNEIYDWDFGTKAWCNPMVSENSLIRNFLKNKGIL